MWIGVDMQTNDRRLREALLQHLCGRSERKDDRICQDVLCCCILVFCEYKSEAVQVQSTARSYTRC
jgi:hypothetical protein